MCFYYLFSKGWCVLVSCFAKVLGSLIHFELKRSSCSTYEDVKNSYCLSCQMRLILGPI